MRLDVSVHIAVVHYPEGAGHATRMMAIARSLEERQVTVSLAGGGSGRRFYEANGYEIDEFPSVNYVRDYQDAEGPLAGLARVLTNSIPDSVRRIRDLVHWMRAEEPDAVLTDDVFAGVAACWVDSPLYVLTHNSRGLYDDRIVRSATWGLTLAQRQVADRFFYPTLWPPSDADPPNVSRVPPVALRSGSEGTAAEHDPGVVLVPSTYSSGFDSLASRLERNGYDVTHVGRDEWEDVPAMMPILRDATAVVCAGYSTIMEAAVAGTPCIIWPETNEQVGVARQLIDREGFAVVDTESEVLVALADPPSAPDHANGDAVVAERVVSDLRG